MFSTPETWSLVHGLVLGGTFILASLGYLIALIDLGSMSSEGAGFARRIRTMRLAGWMIAAVGWLVVLLGTFVVVPWYRAAPPEGASDLAGFPRAYLLSEPDLSFWHVYGMEWKEYVGWIPPILMTVVAYAVSRSGPRLTQDRTLRFGLVLLVGVVFLTASLTGALGALISKVAPVR